MGGDRNWLRIVSKGCVWTLVFCCQCQLPMLHCTGKGKLCLCFNWASHHEVVLGEWRYSSTHSLTPALDGGKWSDSRSGRFIPREKVPGTHWTGVWVGPRAGLDAVVKRRIPIPRRDSPPIIQPVSRDLIVSLSLSLSLAPQPNLGLGLLHNLLPLSGWVSWRLLNNFLFTG
jgi:hypothetical protein